jgi:hypothetical protein
MTGADAKLDYLDKEVKELIEDTDRHRRKEKRIAFWLRIAIVAFSGAITVLLGLQVAEQISRWFSNVALVLGAAITVLSAVDAFYNYRALWIHRTIHLNNLNDLRRRIHYAKNGKVDEEWRASQCEILLVELRRILADGLQAWRQLRGDSNDRLTSEDAQLGAPASKIDADRPAEQATRRDE